MSICWRSCTVRWPPSCCCLIPSRSIIHYITPLPFMMIFDDESYPASPLPTQHFHTIHALTDLHTSSQLHLTFCDDHALT